MIYLPGNIIFANKVIAELENNIDNIGSVTDWAKNVGYTRCYFYTKFVDCFEENPSIYLRKARYQQIYASIVKHPNATSSTIASIVGLKDEQALYIFLSTHYNTNFTELRKQILNGNNKLPNPKNSRD